MIKKEELLKLPWFQLKDWSNLTATGYDESEGSYYVEKKDMDYFIENLYRNMARRIEMPYEDFKEIMEGQNSAFYKLKHRMFGWRSAWARYGRENKELLALESLFMVPDISQIVEKNKADTCLQLFRELSALDQNKLLKKMQEVASED